MGFYRTPTRLTADLVQAGHEKALTELLAEFNRQIDVTWDLLDLDRLDATRAQARTSEPYDLVLRVRCGSEKSSRQHSRAHSETVLRNSFFHVHQFLL